MFNCWWYVCTCELNDELLLKLNSYVKNHVSEYVVFLWKMMKNEVVVWWILEWISWLIVVSNVWKTCCWWIGAMILLISELANESCCWCWRIMKVWWNFEFRQKWCLIHEFWAFLSMCLCILPINIIWDEFWVWKDQNWSVWEKGFLKFEVFFLDWRVFA